MLSNFGCWPFAAARLSTAVFDNAAEMIKLGVRAGLQTLYPISYISHTSKLLL
ncbi:hypothetical protein NYA30BAC_01997 [Halomonas sp. NYA30]